MGGTTTDVVYLPQVWHVSPIDSGGRHDRRAMDRRERARDEAQRDAEGAVSRMLEGGQGEERNVKNTIAIRATMRAVTVNSAGSPMMMGGFAGVSPEPMTATLEFAGAHGPIRIEIPATAVSGLVDAREPGKMDEVRYEVTVRRLRKAPRKKK